MKLEDFRQNDSKLFKDLRIGDYFEQGDAWYIKISGAESFNFISNTIDKIIGNVTLLSQNISKDPRTSRDIKISEVELGDMCQTKDGTCLNLGKGKYFNLTNNRIEEISPDTDVLGFQYTVYVY